MTEYYDGFMELGRLVGKTYDKTSTAAKIACLKGIGFERPTESVETGYDDGYRNTWYAYQRNTAEDLRDYVLLSRNKDLLCVKDTLIDQYTSSKQFLDDIIRSYDELSAKIQENSYGFFEYVKRRYQNIAGSNTSWIVKGLRYVAETIFSPFTYLFGPVRRKYSAKQQRKLFLRRNGIQSGRDAWNSIFS